MATDPPPPASAAPRDPVPPADAEARALARRLLREARFAALAVIDPDTGTPFVSRIGLAPGDDGRPVTLVSALALHTRALRARPDCALLAGEPGARGDPLTHPRLTLRAVARFVARPGPEHDARRAAYLARRPKARLYADLGDFVFVVFDPLSAALNGGFGRAHALTAADLAPEAEQERGRAPAHPTPPRATGRSAPA
jgi:putative heme iron utilization protein